MQRKSGLGPIERLFARVNYERQPWPSREGLKLDMIRELANRLGDPQLSYPVIHLAGTKGKGTTTRLISEIFQASGLRVAAYTSPHLESFNERFCVDGIPVPMSEVEKVLELIWPHVEELDRDAHDKERRSLTFFDISTALGFMIFSRSKPDLVVLETGLGGRLDSTNICQPAVTVITSISLDHCRQLGNNLTDIASEKAGIIKAGVPVICGVPENTAPANRIGEIAEQRNATLIQIGRDFDCNAISLAQNSTSFSTNGKSCLGKTYQYRDLELKQFGEHSAANAAIAIAASHAFRDVSGRDFSASQVRFACSRPGLPGRIEVVSQKPLVILDVAHNPASAEALVTTLNQQLEGWTQAKIRTFLVSISRDKDQPEIIRRLLPCADRIVFTQFRDNPRATDPVTLADLACDIATAELSPGQPGIRIDIEMDPVQAWMQIAAGCRPDHAICVTGSIFLVAELRHYVQKAFQQNQNHSVQG